MTVQELIDRLMLISDKTMPVWAQGCDCDNPASEVVCENISYGPNKKEVVATIKVKVV